MILSHVTESIIEETGLQWIKDLGDPKGFFCKQAAHLAGEFYQPGIESARKTFRV